MAKKRDWFLEIIWRYLPTFFLSDGEEASNLAIFLLLPYLLPVLSVKGKKTIRPCKEEIQSSFILHATSDCDISGLLTARQDKLRALGLRQQPQIVIVGTSLSSIEQYFVVVDNVFYKLQDIISCVDVCFVAFHALSACYQAEASHVWHFIQLSFYKLRTPYDCRYTCVDELMSDLGIHD